MTIKIAESEHHSQLMSLYKRSIADLNGRRIFQWDDKYPNDESVSACIGRREQYLLLDGDRLIGTVVLNETQAEEWDRVDWHLTGKRPCVVHGLVIDPSEQGRGYGKAVLGLCEELARSKGFAAMRLDVFPENRAAVGLYEKFGYIRRGAVEFGYKPEGHREYHCYEKKL